MNENDKSKLNSAFGDIDEKYLDEAALPIKGSKRAMWSKLAASCAVILLVAIPLTFLMAQSGWNLPTPLPPVGESTPGADPLGTPGLESSPDPLTSQIHTPEESTPGSPVAETTPEATLPPEIAGDLSNTDLTVHTNGKVIRSMACLVSASEYDDDDGWIFCDASGADYVINNPSPEIVIPRIEYSAGLFIIIEDNATLNYIRLYEILDPTFSRAPRDVEISDIREIHDYPGEWYVIFNVSYKGKLAPDGEYERANFDHVVSVSISPLIDDVSVSSGGQSVTAKSFFVNGNIYNGETNNFEKHGGAVHVDREKLMSVSEELKHLSLNRLSIMTLDLPENANLGAVTVYDKDLNKLDIFSGNETKYDLLRTLPEGEYYVILGVFFWGEYYNSHALYETAYTDEVFRLTVTEKNETLPMPERFIDPNDIEYISLDSEFSDITDFRAEYYTKSEKLLKLSEPLARLEFTSREPVNINEIEFDPIVGNVPNVMTVKLKSGESITFRIIENTWFGCEETGIAYELSSNDLQTLKTITDRDNFDRIVPDKFDLLSEGLSALKVQDPTDGKWKLVQDTDDIKNLTALLNELTIIRWTADDYYTLHNPNEDDIWSIRTMGTYEITFEGFNYICVNDIWFYIHQNSSAALQDLIGSLQFTAPHDVEYIKYHKIQKNNYNGAINYYTDPQKIGALLDVIANLELEPIYSGDSIPEDTYDEISVKFNDGSSFTVMLPESKWFHSSASSGFCRLTQADRDMLYGTIDSLTPDSEGLPDY